MEIWLSSNLQAHPFIVPSYWAEHLEEVKRLIPQAEVYVHESDGVVNGFLGLTEAGNIAGLFISEQARGQGIGKRLLSKAKRLYSTLLLTVYEKMCVRYIFISVKGFILSKKGGSRYRANRIQDAMEKRSHSYGGRGSEDGANCLCWAKNTMHSVIAAAVCNEMAQRWRLAGLCAVSAGLAAQKETVVCPVAVQAAREFGLEISAHRAQPLSDELIREAGMLVALNRTDYEALLKLAPPDRVYLQESGKDLSAGDVWACRRSVDQAFDGFQDLWLTLRGRM